MRFISIALPVVLATTALVVGCGGQERQYPKYYDAAYAACAQFGGLKSFEVEVYRRAADNTQTFKVEAWCLDDKTIVKQYVKEAK